MPGLFRFTTPLISPSESWPLPPPLFVVSLVALGPGPVPTPKPFLSIGEPGSEVFDGGGVPGGHGPPFRGFVVPRAIGPEDVISLGTSATEPGGGGAGPRRGPVCRVAPA